MNNRFGLAEAALGKGSLSCYQANDEALVVPNQPERCTAALNASNLQLECYQNWLICLRQKKTLNSPFIISKEEHPLREEIFNQGELERLIQSQIRLSLWTTRMWRLLP